MNYVVTFAAAQRPEWNAGGQDFQVYIDNTPVGTFHPSSTSYADYATATFTTGAGAHTVKFVSVNSLGGDHTAFVDNVRVTGAPSPTQASLHWLVSDQLGTPRMVIDQTGSLAGVTRHDYLTFGEELQAGVGGRTQAQGYNGNADGNRKRWAQLERDDETGLDYAQARYYANSQGRFTSPDPLLASGKLEQPQSWNRYTYSLNNPLAYVDPDGLKWYKPKGAGDSGYAPVWFDEDPGDKYEEQKQLVYWGGDEHGWVGLNPLKGEYKDKFQSRDDALQYVDPGQEVSLADGMSEMSMLTGAAGIARGLAGLSLRFAAGFFAKKAATEAAAGLADEAAAGGAQVFQRVVSNAELEATEATGLLRGGREGQTSSRMRHLLMLREHKYDLAWMGLCGTGV